MPERAVEVSKRDRRSATKLAASLGVTLGHGLTVNGHHGSAWLNDGCGRYELVLNLATGTVDCSACGATDLAPKVRRTA